jgi:hypothetical protein
MIDMADVAGSLVFEFGADFSGFTRAADSAGAKLDQLSRVASQWASGTSTTMSRAFQNTDSRPLDITSALPRTAVSNGDDQAGRALTRLSQQLALLQTTGSAHAAIAEQMKIEAAQAKLGSNATEAQKTAAAALVQQIDAATSAQTKLSAAQEATNVASRYGSQVLANGIEALILRGQTLKEVAASILSSFARQGLNAALTGSGPLAGLFGTQATSGAAGGLFGALGSLLTGSGSAATASFSGLYAGGGTIDSGKWGIVGERGAEVVAGPAAVTPLSKLNGATARNQPRSTQVIQFNVTSPDAPSFARSEVQIAALVSRAVARGQRNA